MSKFNFHTFVIQFINFYGNLTKIETAIMIFFLIHTSDQKFSIHTIKSMNEKIKRIGSLNHKPVSILN